MPTQATTPIHCWHPCPRLGTGSALQEISGEAGTQEGERDKVYKLPDEKLTSYELIVLLISNVTSPHFLGKNETGTHFLAERYFINNFKLFKIQLL